MKLWCIYDKEARSERDGQSRHERIDIAKHCDSRSRATRFRLLILETNIYPDFGKKYLSMIRVSWLLTLYELAGLLRS